MTVRDKITKHQVKLSSSESMTRYALIDPLLKALGWDLSDPGMVSTEDVTPGFIADYVLEGAIVLEAKKLGSSLEKHEKKLIDYTKNKKVRYGVLTDGARWKIYNTDASSMAPKEEFDIRDDTWVVIPSVAKLHRLAVQPRAEPKPPDKYPQPPPMGIPLENAPNSEGMKPRKLYLPDNTYLLVRSWANMYAGIVGWLLDNDKIKQASLPITTGRIGVLLGLTPHHQNGKPFKAWKSVGVGDFCLNTNLNSRDTVKHSIRLIQDEAKMRKEQFSVEMD